LHISDFQPGLKTGLDTADVVNNTANKHRLSTNTSNECCESHICFASSWAHCL